MASFDEATFVCPAARCPQHGAKHIYSGLVLGAASLLAARICVEMCGSLRDAASPFAKACPCGDGLVWQMLPLDGACPFPFVDTAWRPKGKARCWKAALVRSSTTRQGAVCSVVSPKKNETIWVSHPPHPLTASAGQFRDVNGPAFTEGDVEMKCSPRVHDRHSL